MWFRECTNPSTTRPTLCRETVNVWLCKVCVFLVERVKTKSAVLYWNSFGFESPDGKGSTLSETDVIPDPLLGCQGLVWISRGGHIGKERDLTWSSKKVSNTVTSSMATLNFFWDRRRGRSTDDVALLLPVGTGTRGNDGGPPLSFKDNNQRLQKVHVRPH